MSTVDEEIAKRIRAGEWPEDRATRIVRYDNAFGGVGYGVTFGDQNPEKYLTPSEYIRNPQIWWDYKRDGYQDGTPAFQTRP